MSASKRPAWLRYGVALVALAGTLCATTLLGPETGAILFFAVVFSAWFGGWGPGVLSIGIIVTLGLLDAFQHKNNVPATRYLGIALIGLLGLVVILLVEALHVFRRRAEEHAEALRDADRRKDEFLAMLAHELRNPLAAIGCAVELREGVETSAEDRVWSDEVVSRQSNHLSRLIDDLLDVSRITRGKIRLRTEPVEIGALVEDTVASACPLISERKHQVAVTLPDTPLYVHGDPVRLQQVLVNLLNNAAKYTETGGHIDVVVRKENDTVVLSVQDNGVGIPADQLPRMFTLFEQADRSLDRSEGGLGIGLTLVRSLVELHGGTVTARSEGLGAGSTFTVQLPAWNHVPELTVAPAAEGPEPVPTPSLRLLVVDDNIDTARGMAKLLQRQGHQVETCYDGATALETAHWFGPHVVLLDIGLPGMNGYEVASRLRGEGTSRHPAVIAISGYAKDHSQAATSMQSAFDFQLVKPVPLDQLLSILAEIARTQPGNAEAVHERA